MTIAKEWLFRFVIVLGFGFGAVVLLALAAPKASALSVNLFDKNATDTNNGYMADVRIARVSGATYRDINNFLSEYIPVTGGLQYILDAFTCDVSANVAVPGICFYDSNYAFISGVAYPRVSGIYSCNNFSVTAPVGSAYCRLNISYDTKDTASMYQSSYYTQNPSNVIAWFQSHIGENNISPYVAGTYYYCVYRQSYISNSIAYDDYYVITYNKHDLKYTYPIGYLDFPSDFTSTIFFVKYNGEEYSISGRADTLTTYNKPGKGNNTGLLSNNFPNYDSVFPKFTNMNVYYGDTLLFRDQTDSTLYWIENSGTTITFGSYPSVVPGEVLPMYKTSYKYKLSMSYTYNGDTYVYTLPNYYAYLISVDWREGSSGSICTVSPSPSWENYSQDIIYFMYDFIMPTHPSSYVFPPNLEVTNENLEGWVLGRNYKNYQKLYMTDVIDSIAAEHPGFTADDMKQTVTFVLHPQDDTYNILTSLSVDFTNVVEWTPRPDNEPNPTDLDNIPYTPRNYDLSDLGNFPTLDNPDYSYYLPDFDEAGTGFFAWLVGLIFTSPFGVIFNFALTCLVVGVILRGS